MSKLSSNTIESRDSSKPTKVVPPLFGDAICSTDVQKLIKSALEHANTTAEGQKYICTDDLLWALHSGPSAVDGRRVQGGPGSKGVWDVSQLTPNVRVVLEAARQKAEREQNSQVIGTEDLLWAMFHSPTMEDRATNLLRAKGISRDTVWGTYSFTNNVHLMFDVARKQADKTGSTVIGTEDLLWAMFNSPSIQNRAVSHLSSKGITGNAVWGLHKFTPNVHRLLEAAQVQATRKQEEMIGTEDILHALFHTPNLDTRAAGFMLSKGVGKEALFSAFRYTDNAQKVLDRARKQAIANGAELIGTEDILNSLMSFDDGTSRASVFLRSLGVPQNVTAYPTILRTNLDQEMKEEDLSKVFLIGGLSGAIEVFIQQPLISWKTALQRGESLTMSPRSWFRGVGINAASIAPITAVQYSADAGLMRVLMGYQGWTRNSEVPVSSKLAVAAAAGALSGVVVTPAELVMINQQCSGSTMWTAIRHLYKAGGPKTLMRGFTPTLLRETGWTMSFLGLAPTVKDTLKADSKFFQSSDVGASIVSSVVAGLVAAVLTQPVDTIKTRMQADTGLHGPIKYKSSWATGKQIFQEGGVRMLYRGLVPRSARVTGAVFILGEAATILTKAFDKMGIY